MYMYILKWLSIIYLVNFNNIILEYLYVIYWIIYCNFLISNLYSCGFFVFFLEYFGDLC